MRSTLEEIGQFIADARKNTIRETAINYCIDILNDVPNHSVMFDWIDGDAPSIDATDLSRDTADAYVSRLYVEDGILKADLHFYYLDVDKIGVSMSEQYSADMVDVLEYLINTI